jgi:exonuclease V gamma subunit
MAEKAEADVEESEEAIEDYEQDIAELQQEKERALEEINQKWREIADDMTEIPVTPYKKDVLIDLFGVAWMPFHVVQVEGEILELPGFGEG